ncbi:MAG: hypothetical protein GY856_43330 [bacterium]|nr:hypothetical protein [bacterium]
MCRSLPSWLILASVAGALIGGAAAPAAAQGCNSPPQAVADVADHLGKLVAVDVLANDSDPDGEALSVTVVGWTCHGTVEESLGLVTLNPDPPRAEDCTISYRLTDERGGLSDTVAVEVQAVSAIFADDFESADVSAWSECVPPCP